MNYYRRYIGDYQRDTRHLSLSEHGAYALLLDAYYATCGRIPRHLSELNRICGASTKAEKDAVMRIAQDFFPTNESGERTNNRADKEISIAKKAIEKMTIAGKAGAKKRWGTL
jgi:uncharacterized protein YdaU (DUF1376 family)